MSLPIVLRPEATSDVEQVRDYLETQRPGLGQRFLDALNDTLDSIATMPELYGVAWQNVRASTLRQFTYVVYYRAHDDRVEVLAVLHASRDPSVWQSRG